MDITKIDDDSFVLKMNKEDAVALYHELEVMTPVGRGLRDMLSDVMFKDKLAAFFAPANSSTVAAENSK